MKFKPYILIFICYLPQFIFAQNKSVSVYIFLSESCTICQSYTLTLKELYQKYSKQNVEFIGVFPNYYANKDSIAAFKTKYSIPFELMIDTTRELTKRFNATITPEVFVEDNNKNILYKGRIDDSFYRIGKRRKVITSNDLSDAISLIILNKKIKTPETKAVGCLISTLK